MAKDRVRMMRLNKLADGFLRRTEEDWRKAAAEGLGKRPFESLTGRSDDGIAIGPIYPAATDRAPIAGRAGGAAWKIIQRIDEPDPAAAKAAIASEIEGGADGIGIVFSGSAAARGRGVPSADAARLLDGLGRADLFIRIDGGAESVAIGRTLRAKAGRGGWEAASLTLAFDPIAALAAEGAAVRPLPALLDEIAEAATQSREADEAVIADGRIWHNGGASEAQELGAAIAAFVTYFRELDERGLAPAKAAAAIGFALAADADQFLTIAKFRALRLLHARVLDVAGIAPRPARIHAETSWRMLTKRDRHVNILRSTAAAFAAGLGGADSVTTLAFDAPLGTADGHARRLARNSQLVLIEEAGLAHVADPGAGSGAVEALTDALAEAAWEHFRAIETEGGLLAAVRSGNIQRAIAATASARSEQVRRLARPITGTSEFPNLAEPPIIAASVSPTAGPGPVAREESVTKLAMARLAEPFETLRERAEKMDRPTVFLASIGRKAEFAEIATAAANFFGVAGIKTIEEAVGDGSRLAEIFRQAGTPLACLCAGAKGTDAAVAAAQTLKAAGAGHIYFIGTGGDIRDKLKAAGVDRFIEDGIDAAELLSEALDTLSGARRG